MPQQSQLQHKQKQQLKLNKPQLKQQHRLKQC
jgi:hypothetical protein